MLQVAEIMLTLVTVNDPPLPAFELDAPDDGDVADAELLGDAELSIAPDVRPVTITWWPMCSARFTEESAISWNSFDPAPLIDPGVRVAGSLALAPAESELALLLAPPIFASFSTKPLATPALLDGLALLLELLALLARCRQPVAVTCPAISLDGGPVGSLLCGLGLCRLGICGFGLCGLELCGLGLGG